MEQTQIDYKARAERDAGMAQATGHANDATPFWSELAYIALEHYVYMAVKPHFTSYDFIEVYKTMNRDMPPTNKAFGSIFTKAARNGLIRKVGYRPHPLRHASPTVLWQVC